MHHSLRAWLVLLVWLASAMNAHAISLIRDTEIETALAELSRPIFRAAGLDPESVNIYIVNDRRLNAFVAGGQNLFIHTGLIQSSQSMEQLAGVIAHEAGHIAGGHLTRLSDASQAAGAELFIGALLGAAAALAGAPQLGTAIIAGGATVAERNFLAFSRGQEQAADQAAVSYLDAMGMSPRGLLEFFEILQNRNLGISQEGSEFLRTHPLTRDRIQFLEREVEQSRFADQPNAADLAITHARITAKLDGFLNDRERTLREWTGDSLADRYARTIADYRNGRLDAAMAEMEAMLSEAPDDPYLHELEGQMLFESGRIEAAVAPYRKAYAGLADSALVRLGLARALIERNQPGDLEEAVDLLKFATRLEPRNPTLFRFLGIAQGRMGEVISADLSLAESAIIRNRKSDADLYLGRARRGIDQGDTHWLKLQDLLRARAELDRQR